MNHWITGKLVNWKIDDRKTQVFPINQLTSFPVNQYGERGSSILVATMGVGLLVGLLATAILAMGTLEHRRVQQATAATQEMADQWGLTGMAVHLLAERLQSLPPVKTQELANLLPGVHIEDEGGKLSLPLTAYALPTVLSQFGVMNHPGKTAMVAEALGLSIVVAPYLSYPMLQPSNVLKGVPRFESAEDLWGFLELSQEEIEGVGRWFTPCETVGINVNTADLLCVEAILAWQRTSAMTWHDRTAVVKTGTRVRHLYPMPGQEQLVEESANQRVRPDEVLATTLPSLFPTDPAESYSPMNQLVQIVIRESVVIPWLYHPQLPPQGGDFRWAFWTGRPPEYFNPKFGDRDKPYAVRSNAWMGFQSVPNATFMVNGRPHAVQDLTQSLGLAWYTPESWFMPMTSSAVGNFKYHIQFPIDPPPKALNVGLSAAAFTGWLSLQGPGPYRATSEWYRFRIKGSVWKSEVSTDVIVRVDADEVPTVLAAVRE